MTASRLGVGVLGIVLAATPTVAAAHPAPAAPPAVTVRAPDPGPVLDELVKGRAARAALDALDPAGQRTVAARNHRSVAQVRAVLADPTAGLSRRGKLFYAEQVDAAPAATALPATTTSPAEALTLHSHPGSDRTIFLDFDGHTLASGAAWVVDDYIPAGTYGASFGAADAAYVETVWRVVAEKYAPFDVDVTTEDPGPAALDRSDAADTTYGSRAVFTDDIAARGTVCPYGSGGSGCAGIAFVDSLDDDESTEPAAGFYEPAWIYTTVGGVRLSARKAADTAAHEVGHNLDLQHDSTSSASYYGGHDDWYPLMGSSNRAIAQWDDSTYPGAVLKDQPVTSDIDTITAAGLPLRADDVPGTLALGPSTTYDGVITTRVDTDTFTLARTCADPLTVAATGIGTGQALDIGLTVTAPDGTVRTVDPPAGASGGTPTGMDATTTFAPSAPGTWTFTVDGVGATVETNSTDYGSLGQYTLAVNGTCPVVPPDRPPGSPTTLTTAVAPHATTMNVTWTAPADVGKPALTGYTVTLTSSGGDVVSATVPGTSTSFQGLVPGTTYAVRVVAANGVGDSAPLEGSQRVPTWAPTASPVLSSTVSGQQAALTFAPADDPGNAVLTGWQVEILRAGVPALPPAVLPATATGWLTPTLPAGSYTAVVTPAYDADDASAPGATTAFVIVTRPAAPRIGTASSGTTGRPVTVTARWAAPSGTATSPATAYRVHAYRLDSANRVVSTRVSALRPSSARSLVMALPAGRYRLAVVALNAVGASPRSALSRIVTAR